MSLRSAWSGITTRADMEIWALSHRINFAKAVRKHKKEEKGKAKQAEKEAKKAYKESNSDGISDEMLKNIYKMTETDSSKRSGLLQKALDGQKLTQYAYWYMTDEKATLVKKTQTDREIINGIASYFGFGRIYDSAGIADLRMYDPSYEDEYFNLTKYVFCIKDFEMKSQDNTFMEKLHNRQKQLFGEDYLEKKAAEEEKAKQEEKLKEEERVEQEKRLKEEETKNEIEEAGRKGEQIVEHQLKYLPLEKYKVIERGEKKGVTLRSPLASDKQQEIDHIVVSPQGVFLIETKYYSSKDKYVINEQEQWIRHKSNGECVRLENPVGQLLRHHSVVEDILGEVDICDIVCVANSEVIIDGMKHSSVPVKMVDMLCQYILNYKNESGKEYSDEEIEEIVRKIEEHRVKK